MMNYILSKFKSYKLYLFIAVSLGSFIRLWSLDRQSLWFDELVSATPLTPAFRQYFTTWLFTDFHPPLYQVFLYFWTRIFGCSEVALRFPGAVASVLATLVMYFMAKKILNRQIATSAAILLAFSGAAIVYAQEARGYSFLLLFSTIATLLWINLIKKMYNNEAGNKDFVVYGVICLLTVYTHYFGVAFVLLQLAYLFLVAFRLKKYKKELVFIVWIDFCLFVPWAVYHFSRIKEIQSAIDWIPKSNLDALVNLISFIFNKKLILFLLIPFFINIRKIIKGILTDIKNLKLDSPVLCFSYLSILPILTIFIIGRFIPVFTSRYFVIVLPASYLLMASLISLNDFFSELRQTIYVFTIALIGLVLFLFVKDNNVISANPFYAPYKQQWRESVKYVADNYDDKSIILVDRAPMYYTYYLNRFLKNKMIYFAFYIHGGVDLDIGRIDHNKFNRAFIFSNFNRLIPQREQDLLKRCYDLKIRDNYGVTVYDCTFSPPESVQQSLKVSSNK